jgi:hypothetical protein
MPACSQIIDQDRGIEEQDFTHDTPQTKAFLRSSSSGF